MKLWSKLYGSLPEAVQGGELSGMGASVKIEGIGFDTRTLKSGELFVAMEGEKEDGHQYIGRAVSQGASGIVCTKRGRSLIPSGVPFWIVDDSRSVLGWLAASYYDYPSRHLQLIGVTGTNGKTTVATFLCQLLNTLGESAGLLSTLEYYTGRQRIKGTSDDSGCGEHTALLGRDA